MKKAIWDSLLDSELNVRYWRKLSIGYSNRDRLIKIFLAIMASGTVASWGLWLELEALWKILSGIAALVAIASPILKYESKIKETSHLQGKWIEVRDEYDFLWATLKNKSEDEVEKEFKRIKNKETEVSKKEENLPIKNKLRIECYNEVLRSRGLKSNR